MSTVHINRAVTQEMLHQFRGGQLAVFRLQVKGGRILAQRMLGLPRPPRLAKIKIRQAFDRVYTVNMDFEAIVPHRYRQVARCYDCPRRWGEHSAWERR